MKIDFKKVRFIKTAIQPKDYPILKNDSGQPLPEFVIVGRSNVGKSSLLNHLFQQKNMARVSATPGKTQGINFFVCDNKISLVDLPGYGYAQAPLEVRKQWGPMVESYLKQRENLKLIVFLIDIRRVPNEDDQQLVTWSEYFDKPLVLVLTKIDKVNQSELHSNTRKILTKLGDETIPYVPYSIKKGNGRKALSSIIEKIFEETEHDTHG